jgi:hypothetical protein
MNNESLGALCPSQCCGLYLIGALDDDTQDAFESHLGRCPSCQDECDDLGPIVTAMSNLSIDDVREAGH